MDKVLFVTLLYDFYGELLTDKQKTVIELHYLNDLSLNEIGEQLGTTRQGVHNIIKRTVKVLERYEERLKLYEKYDTQRKKLDAALLALDKLGADYRLTELKEFESLKKTFSEILD